MNRSFAAIALQLLLLCTSVQGVYIYVAQYSGNISVLELTYNHFSGTGSPAYVENAYFAGFAPDKKYSLSLVDNVQTPATYPAWLTLNKDNILYLVDGVTTGNGTLTAYRTSSNNGTRPPIELDSVDCLLDGAYAGFYANGKALAVAHYTSSTFQTYGITDANGKIKPLQTFTYTMSTTGSSTFHEARTDPLEQYVLAGDLGADKVRIYAIDDDTLLLEERKPLNATPGSGPRHGVFTQEPIRFADGGLDYVFCLGAEIAGTITAYPVKYLPSRGGIHFVPLPNSTYSSLEPGVPKSDTGGKGLTAELRLSPDGNFLIVWAIVVMSVSMALIRYDLQGKLDFVQAAPAGGYIALTYDLNTGGDLAAVGIQMGQRISILERDLGSGLFKEQVAYIDLDDEIWGVLWNDKVND
ncbi:isomerase YbhE [Penicillium malachiteum]|uniref:Isomerase YbhE n=1 Tax=Penicillium malachiteum TaxID=1324776 RepID=A0AAD6HVV0_9EURO|nr:isomerase YbhE [Penicillium malachiteum]